MRVVASHDPASQMVEFWVIEEGPAGTYHLTLDADGHAGGWVPHAPGERPPTTMALSLEVVRAMLDALHDTLPERPEPLDRAVRERESGRVDRMLDAILDGRLQWSED